MLFEAEETPGGSIGGLRPPRFKFRSTFPEGMCDLSEAEWAEYEEWWATVRARVRPAERSPVIRASTGEPVVAEVEDVAA